MRKRGIVWAVVIGLLVVGVLIVLVGPKSIQWPFPWRAGGQPATVQACVWTQPATQTNPDRCDKHCSSRYTPAAYGTNVGHTSDGGTIFYACCPQGYNLQPGTPPNMTCSLK